MYLQCIKDAVIDSPERRKLPRANIKHINDMTRNACYATNTCTCSAILPKPGWGRVTGRKTKKYAGGPGIL